MVKFLYKGEVLKRPNFDAEPADTAEELRALKRMRIEYETKAENAEIVETEFNGPADLMYDFIVDQLKEIVLEQDEDEEIEYECDYECLMEYVEDNKDILDLPKGVKFSEDLSKDDELRQELIELLEEKGFTVKDTGSGFIVSTDQMDPLSEEEDEEKDDVKKEE